jgi:hypothetical protein
MILLLPLKVNTMNHGKSANILYISYKIMIRCGVKEKGGANRNQTKNMSQEEA